MHSFLHVPKPSMLAAMSLLNFSDSGEKPSGGRKSLKVILGIGALVGVVALGSTLAASINLNSNGPVEFGQGVAQTVACSGNDSILVTPTSRFINADGAGDFYYTSVTLSSIPSSCNGVDFTITAYDEGGDSIVLTYCSSPGKGDKPAVNFDGAISDITDATDAEMYAEVSETTSSSFTLTWVGGPCGSAALAKDVYRITIESGGTAQVSNLTEWSEIPWTETDSYGPTVYANSLTNGKPNWIDEVNATFNELTFGFTSNGMHVSGNAGDPGDMTRDPFPYVTTFDIPDTQKVTIQFNFFFNEMCADHGVMLFNSNTTPYWAWGSGSSGLIGQWDCGAPEIGGLTNHIGGIEMDGGTGILNVGQAYTGIFTYDPTLTTNNLTLVTKELDGTQIDSISLTSVLPPGNYKIGFSADQDGGTPNSYFKNLIITIG